MVEFAGASVIFFLLVFSILEIARYMAIRGILTKAAQTSLSYAQKTDALHLDLRPCSNIGTPGEIAYCNARRREFEIEVDRLNLVARNIVLGTFVGDANSNRAAELEPFLLTNPFHPALPSDVGFVRAGERAVSSATNSIIDHPTAPFGSLGTTRWMTYEQTQPYIIQVRARVHRILPWPFVPATFTIAATAIGYPEIPKTTHVPPAMGLPLPPLAIPTASPSPTPQPTPTPTPPTGPTPNPTESPTASPTPPPGAPTETPTPLETPTPVPSPTLTDTDQ
ncbi:MAG: pilus assembly protein, partial [Deltaproteobacteria bacterium]|nr:pilus assembly protein [Deltaproteobacteria bacterium]